MKVGAILQEIRPTGETTATPNGIWMTSDAEAEVTFALAGVFVTRGRMVGRIMAWLQSEDVGDWAVRYLTGGQGVIAVAAKFDAFIFASEFADDIDVGFIGSEQRPSTRTSSRRPSGGRP